MQLPYSNFAHDPATPRNKCLDCGNHLDITESNLFDSRFGTPGIYEAAKCSSCALEQLTPLPTQDSLKYLYEKYYNFGGELGTIYTDLRRKFLFSPLYNFWMAIDGDISFHNESGSGRLLDVGCNEGRGLQFYRRNKWQAEGLELNVNAASVARSAGFSVYTSLIDEFVPAELYDVVVLSNVLEHALDPRKMLVQVCRLLKPGGQVWISCPNGNSLFRKIFGHYWINWHVPFHTVQFSAATLHNILCDSGFDSAVVRQETPALWVAHSIIARLFARPNNPTKLLRNPLLIMLLIAFIRGLFFPFLWLFNRLDKGDCLVVSAKKI